MTLKEIEKMFNRSLVHALDLRKCLCLFLVLLVSGFVVLFFQGLALYSKLWLKLPLQFIPLFLAVGLVMGGGIFLIRLYDQELSGEHPAVFTIAMHSWDVLLKSFYLTLPLVMVFMVFWVLIGVLMLLKSIPYLGPLLGVILAFAPFILNLGILMLFLTAFLAFFFQAPFLAKTESEQKRGVLQRIREDFFLNLLLFAIAYLPVWVVWEFVKYAVLMTRQFYSYGDSQIAMIFQNVLILLPFAAILTPAVIFFFNFAYESHLALLRLAKEQQQS